VSLLPQWQGARATTVMLPASARCTSLSWDSSGNLWAAAGSGIYLLRGASGAGLVRPAVLTVVCPACSGDISSLRVAPDGVRVALIERSGAMAKVMVAAVSKGQNFTYLGQTSQMLQVGSDVTDPLRLTWLDPDHLLVLGRPGGSASRPGGTALYEVPLNGTASTDIPVPGGVTWVAASWPRAAQLPRVVVATARTSRQPALIWAATAGLLNRGWSHVAQGGTPVFSG